LGKQPNLGDMTVISYAKKTPLPTLEDLVMEVYRPTSYSTLNTSENCVHKLSHKTLLKNVNVTLYVAVCASLILEDRFIALWYLNT
jgi:hypothetical protein